MRVPLYSDFDGHIGRIGLIPIGGSSTTTEFKIALPKKPKMMVINTYYNVLADEFISKEI